eukprot:5465628-Alexandrium_andersonii.AAC.1
MLAEKPLCLLAESGHWSAIARRAFGSLFVHSCEARQQHLRPGRVSSFTAQSMFYQRAVLSNEAFL